MKIIFFASFLLSNILLMTACLSTRHYVACSKEISKQDWLISEINYKFRLDKKQNLIIKEIVWNKKDCYGLIVVSKNLRSSHDYLPILVNMNKEVIPLFYFDSKSNGYVIYDSQKSDSLFNRYKLDNSFNANEFSLMDSCIRKGKIHFGSSLFFSDLDLERDSILLNVFLIQSDTIIKIKSVPSQKCD